MQSTMKSSMSAAARLALEELRTLLAIVRASATWICGSLDSAVRYAKAAVLYHLRQSHDATIHTPRPLRDEIDYEISDVWAESVQKLDEKEANHTTPRRCVVVVPRSIGAMDVGVTLRLHQTMVWLTSVGVCATKLVVCPTAQRELYDGYVARRDHSQKLEFPLVFVENACSENGDSDCGCRNPQFVSYANVWADQEILTSGLQYSALEDLRHIHVKTAIAVRDVYMGVPKIYTGRQ